MTVLKDITRFVRYQLIRDKENDLFPGEKPATRIEQILRTELGPVLEPRGFKFVKSSLTFTRKVGDFEQVISVQKSKWNMTDLIVCFRIYGYVIYRPNQWYLSNYGLKNEYFSVHSGECDQIPGWKDAVDGDYDFAKFNNQRLIKSLRDNIQLAALPFFDQLNSPQRIIINSKLSGAWLAPQSKFDLARMTGDKVRASIIVEDYLEDLKKTKYHESIQRHMKFREQVLQHWEEPFIQAPFDLNN